MLRFNSYNVLFCAMFSCKKRLTANNTKAKKLSSKLPGPKAIGVISPINVKARQTRPIIKNGLRGIFWLNTAIANFPEQSNSSPLRKCPKPAKNTVFLAHLCLH